MWPQGEAISVLFAASISFLSSKLFKSIVVQLNVYSPMHIGHVMSDCGAAVAGGGCCGADELLGSSDRRFLMGGACEIGCLSGANVGMFTLCARPSSSSESSKSTTVLFPTVVDVDVVVVVCVSKGEITLALVSSTDGKFLYNGKYKCDRTNDTYCIRFRFLWPESKPLDMKNELEAYPLKLPSIRS